ncbi:MAG: sugar ABC transporter permease [Clostridia bacterium]|nr:sugar ABC transporter permease [Clostridia bacterium]
MQNKSKNRFRNEFSFYVMLAPFTLMFLLFLVLPIIASVALSFTSYDMVHKMDFVGFSNYFRMFVDDEVFLTTVKNTILFSFFTGPVGFLLSFVLAWFINEFKTGIRTFLSFLFYAPALVGNAYYIWQVAFSNDSYGYINSVLLSMNLITEPIAWLKNEAYVLPVIMIVQLWQSMGISFLSNISGLQNVNDELYEAGAIDGIRSRWQELWYITLPAMKHMLLFSAVMQIQSSFTVGTIAVELAGYPSVGNAADTMVAYMSDVGTVRYELGYACSVAVCLFVIMAFARWLIGKVLNGVGK